MTLGLPLGEKKAMKVRSMEVFGCGDTAASQAQQGARQRQRVLIARANTVFFCFVCAFVCVIVCVCVFVDLFVCVCVCVCLKPSMTSFCGYIHKQLITRACFFVGNFH